MKLLLKVLLLPILLSSFFIFPAPTLATPGSMIRASTTQIIIAAWIAAIKARIKEIDEAKRKLLKELQKRVDEDSGGIRNPNPGIQKWYADEYKKLDSEQKALESILKDLQ